MTALDIRPLQDGLDFGARVRGVTPDNIYDEAVRAEIGDLFIKAGVVVFEEIESSGDMQEAISTIAGPLKDHLQKSVPRVDADSRPGVIDIVSRPEEGATLEVDGVVLASWSPWHFDHCYNNELNRAGVLRALELPPDGGMTGFADGIAMYKLFSPELRDRIEGKNVLYKMNVIMDNLRFGRPEGFKVFGERPTSKAVMEEMADKPRAAHPAVWRRKTGELVLHVSPWMAEGIEGEENAEGNALLDAVCREVFTKAKDCCYFHKWKTTDMVLWDNWRMLHAVSGHTPGHRRRLQRTTIKGDYGLGRFEHEPRDMAQGDVMTAAV